MSPSQIVLRQIIVLFLLIFLGGVLRKIKVFQEASAKVLTDLLYLLVTPCVIVSSMMMENTPERMNGLLICLGSAFLTHSLGVILATCFYRDKERAQRAVLRMSFIFSNCGFMGLPLMEGVLGPQGIFYGSVYVAVFNLFTFTYGIYNYTGKSQGGAVKTFLKTPAIIAIMVGLVLFLTGWYAFLPRPIVTVVQGFGGLNTSLSMLLVGNRLAQVNFKSIFIGWQPWIATGIRNILMPLLSLLILRYVFSLQGELLLACILPIACPCSANSLLFAEKYDADTRLGSSILTVSTLASIATIPLFVVFIGLL